MSLTKTIINMWVTAQIALKKQIAILESHDGLSFVFEGLELKEIGFIKTIYSKRKVFLFLDLFLFASSIW